MDGVGENQLYSLSSFLDIGRGQGLFVEFVLALFFTELLDN
jgi:hypothetical protein